MRRHDKYSPDARIQHKEDPLTRLRSTLLKIEDRTSDLYTLRNSYSSISLRTIGSNENNDFRMSNLHSPKKKVF